MQLEYANVDLERLARQGMPEVIYGQGKEAQQIVEIARVLIEARQSPVLITRIDEAKACLLREAFGETFEYWADGKIGRIGKAKPADGKGTIAVVTAGTSDGAVAREAIVTAETLGNKVSWIFDVGVAGIHRLLGRIDEIRQATAVIAIAGMEGALASVVGGLVASPVIAVPTSVGYGASFGGLAALLSMLNTCAAGVATVNIDNGFGAAVMASRINHVGQAEKEVEAR